MKRFGSLSALIFALLAFAPGAEGAGVKSLSEATANLRVQEEQAFTANPALQTMQSWLDDAAREAQSDEFAALQKQTTRYIDEHLSNDAVMSAYYALRGAARQIAEEKITRKILDDAQLRSSWLEIRREELAKTSPGFDEKTSLAKVEQFVKGQLETQARDASARIEKIQAEHAFPKFVSDYVERWADTETRSALAKIYIAAKTPEGLRSARNELDQIQRIQSEAGKDSPTTFTQMLGPPVGGTIADLAPDSGPEVVVLRELENTYEPVPFDHKSHAKMAQMWDGCMTCHHRSPHPTNEAGPVAPGARKQQEAAKIPACKSCHAISAEQADIHMPTLKAAYHRQCLNCHQEWMHENACGICHKPKNGAAAQPTADDIVGRMHPPIPEPETKVYKTRFSPAAGVNVTFRHKEHTEDFSIKCAYCHHRDNCEHCHNPKADTAAEKPLRPGWTWIESHGPCMNCHKQDRCSHCHYKDGQPAPRAFAHRATGQELDKDHANLACAQCHLNLRMNIQPTCGDAACHKRTIEYPIHRPGVLTAMPHTTATLAHRPVEPTARTP